jgi:altronate dehydratase small subunit
MWILQRQEDHVATAIAPLAQGTVIHLGEGTAPITLAQPIPFGHKFSVRDIPVGTMVRKYGQVIGAATEAISTGEHVHVHNLASTRGRGDLVQQGGTPS